MWLGRQWMLSWTDSNMNNMISIRPCRFEHMWLRQYLHKKSVLSHITYTCRKGEKHTNNGNGREISNQCNLRGVFTMNYLGKYQTQDDIWDGFYDFPLCHLLLLWDWCSIHVPSCLYHKLSSAKFWFRQIWFENSWRKSVIPFSFVAMDENGSEVDGDQFYPFCFYIFFLNWNWNRKT